jgi:hypothetical protein
MAHRSTPQFPHSRRLRRCHGRGNASRVRAIELLTDRPQLPLLELADANAARPIGRQDHRRVHQLEHRPLVSPVLESSLHATAPVSETPTPINLPRAGDCESARLDSSIAPAINPTAITIALKEFMRILLGMPGPSGASLV